jgi:uncharacterized membrane protein YuzA (DUF378 family)
VVPGTRNLGVGFAYWFSVSAYPPPPPPPGYTPQRKNNTTLILVIILVVFGAMCVGMIGLLGFGAWVGVRGAAPIISCVVGFEEVRQAVIAYSNDNGGRLPDADQWQDQVAPYYAKGAKDDIPFAQRMSAEGDWGCKSGESMTGMAFNSELSGKLLSDIKDPRGTVLLFEIETPRRNASEPFKRRPKETAPKMFGTPRDWIVVRIEGDPEFGPGSGSRNPSMAETSNADEPADR